MAKIRISFAAQLGRSSIGVMGNLLELSVKLHTTNIYTQDLILAFKYLPVSKFIFIYAILSKIFLNISLLVYIRLSLKLMVNKFMR